MVAAVADLIGPNVKLHHTKINSKLPRTPTKVDWHQDFPFTPHSNDDLVTALLMVDDVTDDNGPLEVLPGSHKGPIESLWHDGRFTGAVDRATTERCDAHAPAARLRAQQRGSRAHALHCRLFGRGRHAALRQPAAEPPRGPYRPWRGDGHGARHAILPAVAAETERRVLLRAADGGTGRRVTGLRRAGRAGIIVAIRYTNGMQQARGS
jgi:hypothetical protein